MRRSATSISMLSLLLVSAAVAGSASAQVPVAAGRPATFHCEGKTPSSDTVRGGGGRGRCTASGAVKDRGSFVDYRSESGGTIQIRRVFAGNKGTLIFRVTIKASSGAKRWSIASGTRAYAGLRGSGTETGPGAYGVNDLLFTMRGFVHR